MDALASAAAAQCGSVLHELSLSLANTPNRTQSMLFHCGCCRVPSLLSSLSFFATLNMPCQHFVAFQFSNSVSVRYYSSLCECTDAHVQTPYCHRKQQEEEKKKKKTLTFFDLVFVIFFKFN